jgi:hypothetical protein
MSDYYKVKDKEGLVRDAFSKAVLAVDREALLQHRNKAKVMKEILNNSDRINKLENDMAEVKNMLSLLCQKLIG